MRCMCALRGPPQSPKPMGVAVSSGTAEDQRRRHQLAEKIIAEDKRRNATIFKLLLLGKGLPRFD